MITIMHSTKTNRLVRSMMTALALLITASAYSQTTSQNYVRTRVPRTKINNNTTLNTLTSNKDSVMTSIQYVDGIGRPLQTIQVKGSPQGFDVVQPFVYDNFGRQSTSYLPYAPQTGTAGAYRTTAVTDQGAFYTTPPSGSGVSAIADPFSQTNYDNSPLNRTVEQGFPGAPWQLSTSGVTGSGHTVKMVYTLNNDTTWTADSVKSRQVALFTASVASNQNRTITANGYYPANTLTVTISKDENWVSGRAGTVEEYKDKEGHVVCKRVYNYAGGTLARISTYYVYDDMGELAFVLPPMANGDASVTPGQTTLGNLCYQYRYDERGRMAQKKIPGKGWEYTVYNTIDQPVATQDSLQRAQKNWIVTKYDAMGRPVLTDIWNNGGTAVSRASLQTTLTAINTNLWEAPTNTGNGYTNVAWPTSSTTATLSTDYYDTYTNIPSLPTTYTVTTGISNMTRGTATVKKTAILNTPTDQLWDVIYYDDLGRTTQSYAQHYLGGTANTSNYDLITTTYNFTNAPTTTTRKHYTTGSATIPLVTIANQYIYDQMGRKLKTWEQITKKDSTATPRTLVSRTSYNEISQLLNKHLQGAAADSVNGLQTIAYAYNERGWMVTSTAPLFALQLYYNTGTNKQYNGNIMYQYWGTPGSLSNAYTYFYDKLNRLVNGGTNTVNKESAGYDQNGNITALNRYQVGTQIDQLTYTYTVSGFPTNQLQSVGDASGNNAGLVSGTTNYTYDGNGSMLTQTNTVNTGQNKTIKYNLLNLPDTVTTPTTSIKYYYTATGEKVRKVAVTSGVTTTTVYDNGIQYLNTGNVVDFVQTEEGKAVLSGAGANYTYYLGDNLGNTRVTFQTKTGSAVTIQKDDYYPFGMEINTQLPTPPTAKNEYLYNKKELQEELQEYDYGARFYDPVIGRWGVVDPLAEKSRRWSPYNYVENDPIRLTDPDGMDIPGQGENGDDPWSVKEAKRLQEEEQKKEATKTAATMALAAVPGGPGPGKKTNKKEQQSKKLNPQQNLCIACGEGQSVHPHATIDAKLSVGPQVGADFGFAGFDFSPISFDLITSHLEWKDGTYQSYATFGPYLDKEGKYTNTGGINVEDKASAYVTPFNGGVGLNSTWGFANGQPSPYGFNAYSQFGFTTPKGYFSQTTTNTYTNEFLNKTQTTESSVTFSLKFLVGIELTFK